jgi:hypothetical protein
MCIKLFKYSDAKALAWSISCHSISVHEVAIAETGLLGFIELCLSLRSNVAGARSISMSKKCTHYNNNYYQKY